LRQSQYLRWFVEVYLLRGLLAGESRWVLALAARPVVPCQDHDVSCQLSVSRGGGVFLPEN
jgi:hypothetical protein